MRYDLRLAFNLLTIATLCLSFSVFIAQSRLNTLEQDMQQLQQQVGK